MAAFTEAKSDAAIRVAMLRAALGPVKTRELSEAVERDTGMIVSVRQAGGMARVLHDAGWLTWSHGGSHHLTTDEGRQVVRLMGDAS